MRSTSDSTEKSAWSIVGCAHKFFLAWEKAGGSVAMINKLAESPGTLTNIIGVLLGAMVIVEKQFPVWRSVTLGCHTSSADYAEALMALGDRFGHGVRNMLLVIACSQEIVDLELVIVTGRDLGFTSKATLSEILESAASFGLVPCPAETGLALREQYRHQPADEMLFVAMEPVLGSSGTKYIFRVDRDGTRFFLRVDNGFASNKWPAHQRWVFVREQSSDD